MVAATKLIFSYLTTWIARMGPHVLNASLTLLNHLASKYCG